jgi:hypothetical protein
MHAFFISAGDPVRVFSIGDRVSQPQYGAGTVAAANEYHTTIDFDDHGPRTFATPMVKLERSATAAPPRPKAARRKAAPRRVAAALGRS